MENISGKCALLLILLMNGTLTCENEIKLHFGFQERSEN